MRNTPITSDERIYSHHKLYAIECAHQHSRGRIYIYLFVVYSFQNNEKCVADITAIWTQEGWLYVAGVLDLFSRTLVGWAMGAVVERINSS